ncbi:PREDICTED: protein cab-1 [Acromyrmex echinatior]|nr:PREDICTED: protein cab-1 [Acromyrmex echinatior]
MLLQRGCTWLTLMPLLLSLSTGELSFYRDALPETSEDVALKLARYLEAHRLQQRLHRSHLPTFLSSMYKKHNSLLDHQEEREVLLKLLSDRKDFLEWLTHFYRQNQITEPNYLSSYFNLDLKRPTYSEEKQPSENDGRFSKDLGYGKIFDVNRDPMESTLDSFQKKYMDFNHGTFHHEGGMEAAPIHPATAAASGATEPEFTYKFDDSNLKEKHPFAVKPNDPRYYGEEPFSSDDLDWQDNSRMTLKEEKIANKERTLVKHEDDMRNVKQEMDLTASLDVPEPDRLAGHHPVSVPINQDFNNDIYFIAIVAGCSAAAMFALVLISLTWCRLQRGAKAAADIEYPAYGVTGPNKDVSPSGDQRLAQSAQMYHFQHQKQQIIAMENRTSATRDPGSLSEAESDEENEEGDYTVYECPGLASTGEMEVKNPMFHDDPTPATPATQSNKEEDHI